jgi:hypothetical protein
MEKISPNAQLSIEGKTKVYLIVIYSIFVIFYLILLPIITVSLLSLGKEKKIFNSTKGFIFYFGAKNVIFSPNKILEYLVNGEFVGVVCWILIAVWPAVWIFLFLVCLIGSVCPVLTCLSLTSGGKISIFGNQPQRTQKL